MAQKTRFVVIANPRTGTNNFIDLINSHPDISCHREVFHPATVYLMEGTRDNLREKRNSDPLAFLNELYVSSQTRACGFKIFMDHNDTVLDNVIRDKSIKKIVLYRPNLLAVHSSAQIAVTDQRWYAVNEHQDATLNKLALIHIPKTAGISLHSVLEEHFGKDSSIRFGSQESRSKFIEMQAESFKKFNFISGHISINELNIKEIFYPKVCVVRNPTERLLSMFRYRKKSKLSEHIKFRFNDVKSFAEHLRETKRHNMQCWHLSGTQKSEDAIETIYKESILVAPLEYYDDFLNTISGLIGSKLKNVYYNVTAKDESEKIKHSDFSSMESLIDEDFKLFKHVRKHYKEIKENFIENTTKYISSHHNSENLRNRSDQKKVIFDKSKFERDIMSYKKHYKYVIDILNQTNQEYLFITYEDYINENLIRRVFPFLGLKQPDILRTRMKKINSKNILSRYENVDDVIEYLKNTNNLNWAHEGFMLWT